MTRFSNPRPAAVLRCVGWSLRVSRVLITNKLITNELITRESITHDLRRTGRTAQ